MEICGGGNEKGAVVRRQAVRGGSLSCHSLTAQSDWLLACGLKSWKVTHVIGILSFEIKLLKENP